MRNAPDHAEDHWAETKHTTELLAHIAVSTVIGFFTHKLTYHWLMDSFTERSSRLGAYGIGYLIDIPGSWLIIRSYNRVTRKPDERREDPPLRFERYFVTRIISGLALGAGVVLGYLLDNE